MVITERWTQNRPQPGLCADAILPNPIFIVKSGFNTASSNLLTVAVYAIIIKSAFYTKIRK
ncbi:hypothetical protein D0A34_03240 [Microcoleus vaginatus PCC 9802]|nr:hypothetical protein D0A34_03240 [Microcoleus vaginatus PCC 9802]